jgi:hypothetical protein
MRLDAEISIAVWIWRSHTAPGLRALVSQQLARDKRDHFSLDLDGRNLEFASHVLRGMLGRPIPPALGRWVHLAVVRAADGTTRLFADGVELGRRRSAGRLGGGSPTPLTIGGALNGPDPDTASEHFEGALDELRLYRRALTDEEIRALASGATAAPPER